MRFFNTDDDKRLTRMVAEGAIARETLEKAVGDRSVVLFDALVEHGSQFPSPPWLAWGIRQGLARVNGVRASQAFIRDLNLDSETLRTMAMEWAMPFARNAYGQVLVACAPCYQPNPELLNRVGDNRILCVATFQEMSELRYAYLEAAT